MANRLTRGRGWWASGIPRGRRRASLVLLPVLVLLAYCEFRKDGGIGGGARGPSGESSTGERGFPWRGIVTHVTDGDTLRLDDRHDIRLLGIDAPEKGEAFHDEAARWLEDCVDGKAVELRPAGRELTDTYGRALAAVYAAGKASGKSGESSVNEEILRIGFAWVYIKGPNALDPWYLDALLSAQGSAISTRTGIWAEWLGRAPAGRPKLLSTRFRIHRADCRELKQTQGRPVENLETELRRGKSPCRVCRPFGAGN